MQRKLLGSQVVEQFVDPPLRQRIEAGIDDAPVAHDLGVDFNALLTHPSNRTFRKGDKGDGDTTAEGQNCFEVAKR